MLSKFYQATVSVAAMSVALAFSAGAAHGQALEVLNPPIIVKAAAKKAGKTKKGSGKSVKFMPGSQETVRERTNRLKRECRGAVDAGACSGYTR